MKKISIILAIIICVFCGILIFLSNKNKHTIPYESINKNSSIDEVISIIGNDYTTREENNTLYIYYKNKKIDGMYWDVEIIFYNKKLNVIEYDYSKRKNKNYDKDKLIEYTEYILDYYHNKYGNNDKNSSYENVYIWKTDNLTISVEAISNNDVLSFSEIYKR